MDNSNNISFPEDLITQIINNRVVIFLGAGFSMLGGYPSWEELAHFFINKLFDAGIINFSTKEDFERLKDPKMQISFCKSKDSENILKLSDFLKPQSNKIEKLQTACEHIKNLSSRYITTNYDDFLETYLKQNNTTELQNTIENTLSLKIQTDINSFVNESDRRQIFYLHGNLNSENSLILTTKDYLKFYCKNGKGRRTLETLFDTVTVLFIGVSFREFEILEHIQLKKSHPNYALYSVRNSQKPHFKIYKEHYKNIGIELIDYDISDVGYEKLNDILSNLNDQVSINKNILNKKESDDIKQYNELLYLEQIGKSDIVLESDISKVTNLIKTNEQNKKHFLQNANNPIFLKPLDDTKIFDNIVTESQYEWAPIRYLFSTSEYLKNHQTVFEKKDYEAYITIIQTIILSVLKKLPMLQPAEPSNDIHVLPTVIDILLNFEIKYISDDIIKELERLLPSYKKNEYFIFKLTELFKFYVKHDSTTKLTTITIQILKDSIAVESNRELEHALEHLCEYIYSSNALISSVSEKQIKNILQCIIDKTKLKKFNYTNETYKLDFIHKNDNIIELVGSVNSTNFNFDIQNFSYTEIEKFKDFILKKLPDNCPHDLTDIILNEYYTYIWNDYDVVYSFDMISIFNQSEDDNIHLATNNIIFQIIGKLISFKSGELTEQQFENTYSSFLTNFKSFIFKKILLYCYATNFSKYRKQFFKLLEEEKTLLFMRAAFEPELYIALNKNCSSFDENEIKSISNIIEQGPYLDFMIYKDITLIQKRFWQKQWYSALIPKTEFKRKYEEFSDLGKEHFNFRDMQVREIVELSPFPDTEIINLLTTNVANLVDKINTFNREHEHDTASFFDDKPSIDGLIKTLRKITEENPNLILQNLEKLKIDIKYISNIFYGIATTKQTIFEQNWVILFNFIFDYLQQSYNSMENCENLVRAITEIIDYKAETFISLTTETKQKIKNILLYLIEHKKRLKTSTNDGKDNASYALNSTFGRIIISFISLSFAYGKQNKKTHQPVIWDKDLSDTYKKLLSDNNQEAYIFLGYKFPIFYYLDETYFQNFINTNMQTGSAEWFLFFEQVLLYTALYSDDYILLKKHYSYAIKNHNSFMKKEDIQTRLADTIAIFYLDGTEKFDDGYMLNIVIANKDFILLNKITNFLTWKSTYRLNTKKELSEKEELTKEEILRQNKLILEFWDYMYDLLNETEDISLAKELLHLIPSLSTADVKTFNKYIDKIEYSLNKFSEFQHEDAEILNTLIDIISTLNNKFIIKKISDIFKNLLESNKLMPVFLHRYIHFELLYELLEKYQYQELSTKIQSLIKINQTK